MRLHSITEKIAKEQTGLNGSLYVHVEHDLTGNIKEIRFSHKWKGESTPTWDKENVMDRTLRALSKAANACIRKVRDEFK